MSYSNKYDVNIELKHFLKIIISYLQPTKLVLSYVQTKLMKQNKRGDSIKKNKGYIFFP